MIAIHPFNGSSSCLFLMKNSFRCYMKILGFCCSMKNNIIRYKHKESFLSIDIWVPKLSSCSFLKQPACVTFYKNPPAVFLSSFTTFKLWAIFILFQHEVLEAQQFCKMLGVSASLITRALAAKVDSLIFKTTKDNPLWHGGYTEESCGCGM